MTDELPCFDVTSSVRYQSTNALANEINDIIRVYTFKYIGRRKPRVLIGLRLEKSLRIDDEIFVSTTIDCVSVSAP